MKKPSSFIQSLCFIIFCVLPWNAAYAACAIPVQTPLQAILLLKEDALKKIGADMPGFEIDNISVYDHPAGKIIGDLKITYDPKTQITAALIRNKKSYPFVPVFYDRDWGYGPWFHATLLDAKDAWKKIALPQIASGWVHLPGAPIFQILAEEEKDSIYSFQNRSIKIIGSDQTGLIIREEQPADMWCEEGKAPALRAFETQTLPVSALYDDQCNLLLTPKYKRGC